MNIKKKLEIDFKTFIKDLEKPVAIGFSGGSDSCALLELASKFLDDFDVIYFAHGDNPLVDDDSFAIQWCKDRVKEKGKDLIVVDLNLENNGLGWEATGHNARKKYAFDNYKSFLLGHHMDDVCENYFIQMMRGSGSAMVLKSEKIMKRPLLGYTKNDLKNYLHIHNVSWIEDKTNENTDLTRNFWRRKVLPLIEQYYPDYRKKVKKAVETTNSNNILLKELAQIDGLDNFVETNNIVLNKKLFENDNRLYNLMYFYLKEKGISVQSQQLKDTLKKAKQPNTLLQFNLKNFSLKVAKQNNDIKITVSQDLTNNLKTNSTLQSKTKVFKR